MLDIETLGTEPGAVIVSVGGVRFSTNGLGATFYRKVDVESCEDAGLEIDSETLKWWWEQDDDARDALSGGDELADVLDAFGHFYDGCDEVWAKSPIFDVALLEAAYAAVDQESPWEFWETRDVRTVMDLPCAEELPDDGTEHHALDDAKRQARNVAATLKEVRDE
ncbi:exonuclease [environmental Halophage eHP-14]|nr:exonuclease [environmental Halophage eHP-14]